MPQLYCGIISAMILWAPEDDAVFQGVIIAEYTCLALPSKVTMALKLVAREIASR